MREIFLLLLLLGIVQAHSSARASNKEKQVNLTPPGQTTDDTEDPGSATRLLYKDPSTITSLPSTDKKGSVAGTPTCTDNMGMVYKQGAAGYDGCLRTFGSGTPPQLPGDKKNKSLGITIGQ